VAKGKKLTRAQRKAISEGKRRFWREQYEQGWSLPKKKRCPRCKRVKAASAFGRRRYKLKSVPTGEKLDYWCKKCNSKAATERRNRRIAEGIDVRGIEKAARERRKAEASPAKRERERERSREWSAIRRRKNGAAARGAYKQLVDKDREVPAAPLAMWLQKVTGAEEETRLISKQTGVPERRIGAILRGEQLKVRLSTVDRILTGLGSSPHELNRLYPLD